MSEPEKCPTCEFYPCKPDIFDATYEPTEEPTP
jgi:hypothetical protein